MFTCQYFYAVSYISNSLLFMVMQWNILVKGCLYYLLSKYFIFIFSAPMKNKGENNVLSKLMRKMLFLLVEAINNGSINIWSKSFP